MPKEINLVLSPQEASNEEALRTIIKQSQGNFHSFRIIRRSIDARSRNIKFNLRVLVYAEGESVEPLWQKVEYQNVSSKAPVIIAGAGPAGLFAALKLIELGLKPIIFERGKDVRNRRRDLAALNKQHMVNPDSNYCFGEGGAGTYSDGKLYTRSTKRGDVQKILSVFVQHGASENILVDAHPHIGTNKLPHIITAMREVILDCGGEIHFDSKISDIKVSDGAFKAVILANGDACKAQGLILATGHSARDIFELLYHKGILIEAKPFALGVRAEHPQRLIDSVQYHCDVRSDLLPPASYSLVHQVEGKGVYSFCMCPGGIIAPCATNPGEVVTNGWSPSKRNNPYANSGIVVSIEPQDYKEFEQFGPLAAMKFQQKYEQLACRLGGGTQTAPAQRLEDFVNGKVSGSLPDVSYQPGIQSVDMREVLPGFVHKSLQEAFKAFGKKMRGYLTNDAVVVGVESRTSSPVRIPRDRETLQHPQVNGLFPCGEGAGYAGGIVSAAIDGERCATAVAQMLGING